MFGLIAGIASIALGAKGKKDADKAADRQAAFDKKQNKLATDEKLRRLDVQKRQLLGSQLAGAAASGVSVSSKSILQVQDETIKTIEDEKKYVKEIGAFDAQAADLSARAAKYDAKNNSLSMALSGAQQIFGHFNR